MKYAQLVFFFVLVACVIPAFGQRKLYLLALSKAEKKLFVLDYRTLDLVTKIAVGDDPHEIVTSADGSLAYVSNPSMNGNGHRIDVLNLRSLQPEKIIDTKPFYIPHGLVYLNDRLWFTAQGSKVVCVYNVKDGQVEQVFGTGQDFTHLLHVTSDERRFYTTNVESGTISIYELKDLPPYMPPTGVLPPNAKARTEWRQKLVNAGSGVEGFDVSPDGRELWAARPDGHIIVLDPEKKKIKADINSKVQGLHRLCLTPDGKTVCVVSVKTGDLLFYSAQTHKLEHRMNVGHGAGLYIDKENNRLFVSCTGDNQIVVIDLATRKEVKRIEIGRPDGVKGVVVE